MHETHRQAAEQHELAAPVPRTAAEHNEKGIHSTSFSFGASVGLLKSRLHAREGSPQ